MEQDPIPGMESVVATVSGYRGIERQNLIKLMTHSGACYVGVLSRANAFTHLVCRKFEGKKFQLAKKMKLVVVNHQWIEECIKQKIRVPEQPYTLHSGKEVGPLLLEVPLIAEAGFSTKNWWKRVCDKPKVFGDFEQIVNLGCGSSRRAVLTDSYLLNEKSPEIKESNNSQKSQKKPVKRNSKQELQSTRTHYFEDLQPSRSPNMELEDSCTHFERAKRHIPSGNGTNMAETSRKRRKLVRKNIGSTFTILSDDSDDGEYIRSGIRNDGRKGVEIGGKFTNHLCTSKDLIGDAPTAPEGTPQKGCAEVENSREELKNRVESENPTVIPSSGAICVICFEECSSTLGILPCGHRYCYDCIEKWAKQQDSSRQVCRCPICKATFTAITRLVGASAADQKVYSQTIPSAPKVHVSFFAYQGTSDFTAQILSINECCECHYIEPEDVLIRCNVCEFRCIHNYCQEHESNTWTCKHCKDLQRLYRTYQY